ncbi:carbohydrate ABC transporter permease [Sporolactobacillus shoreae]|nr:sugar ABC transporter permease [Sporolactobacillus shoreae]
MLLKKYIFPYLLILPLIIIMIGLVFYPVLVTFTDSFKSMSLLNPGDERFIWLSNYYTLLHDPTVLRTLENTFFYFLLAIVGELIGGLFIAMVLNRKFRGRGLVLAAVIIPWSLPPVVNGIIWKWIYDPSTGVLNDILMNFHIIQSNQIWLGNSTLALLCVTLVHIWKMIPLTAVILLATLQTIPKDLYEAARMDGSSPINIFRFITLPFLKPAIVISLTQSTIAAINIFDEIYVLTGTNLGTRSVLLQNYLIAFQQLNLGQGMALSLMITLITVLISIVYVLWLRIGKGEKM